MQALTRLHRFFMGPQIGDVYERVLEPADPTLPSDPQLVEIVDRCEGRVQIRYLNHVHMFYEWPVLMFRWNHKFINKGN